MVLHTGKLVKVMNNPTVIVITDRNDLDDQLFDTFADNVELLRQPPQQAESTEQLKRPSAGIVWWNHIYDYTEVFSFRWHIEI